MKPTIPITDKRFVYVPAHATDVRETFRRIRAQQNQTVAQKQAEIRSLGDEVRKLKRIGQW